MRNLNSVAKMRNLNSVAKMRNLNQHVVYLNCRCTLRSALALCKLAAPPITI
jgi:hypothetical protein